MVSDLLERLQSALADRYTIERELGRGGMAVVYLAHDLRHDRSVALKVLRPELAVTLGAERFLREIRIAAGLTHPHILPLLDSGEADGFLYYVMPYVAGESLRDRLEREGQLPVEDALKIASEVADALGSAHKQNVIHRDIKPENILLEEGHAVVADFGIARAVTAAGGEQLTETGIAIGTPTYVSPEQASGERNLDGRSDLYSLGCVLFEMLSGQPPFSGAAVDSIVYQHLSVEAPPITNLRPTVQPEVAAALQRALAKNPADRFSPAAQFADALGAARVSIATPASTLRRGIPVQLVAALGLVLVLLAAAVAVALRSGSTHTTPADVVTARFLDSVAVLPVENLTNDSLLDHIADAVTYDVIHELSRMEDLKVTSLQSVRALVQAGVPPSQIGDSLGVRLVLMSSFRWVADRLRVGVELVEAGANNSLWTERWDLQPTGGEGFQRGLVQRLIDGIVENADGLDGRPGEAESHSGPGYEAYLSGRESLSLRTPASVDQAISRFRLALTLDPEYAPAFAALSSAYTLALIYRYEIGLEGYEIAGRALRAANRAIELDPKLARGYAARGLLASRSLGSNEEAAADFTRALELQPNAPEQPSWYAAILVQEGKTEEALTSAERGVSLNPYSPGRRLALALVALEVQRYDIAVREARRVTALEPDITVSRALEGRALLLHGRPDECLDVEFGPHEGVRAACLYELGDVGGATEIVDSITREVERGAVYDQRYTEVTRIEDLACYYAWIGDVTRTLQWLERAYDVSPMGVWGRMLRTGLFARVRSDPRAVREMDQLTAGVWRRVQDRASTVAVP
jgi:serine/threonine-protein kinase